MDGNPLRLTTRFSLRASFVQYIYLIDLFMFLEETKVCNYADDTTIYAFGRKIEIFITHLEHDDVKTAEWFPNNLMKLNEDKCHLIVFGARGGNGIQ